MTLESNMFKKRFEQEDVDLVARREEAFEDLITILNARQIPVRDRQKYVDELASKINTETSEDMIDTVLREVLSHGI